jgi:amino-acid N-acetyltransferase
MPSKRPVVFSEKEFYLDEFRGRTLLFAVHHDGPAERLRPLGEIVRDLLLNDTRVLILLGGGAARARAALKVLERSLAAEPVTSQPAESSSCALPFRLSPADDSETPVLALPAEDCDTEAIREEVLIRIWSILRSTPLFVGICDWSSPDRLAAFAQRIGVCLRVHKLVIVDPQGGVIDAGGGATLSFMDEAVTEHLLQAGEAEWAGLGERRSMLEAIRQGLIGGINSVNLCSLEGLARELFTYEGSGTLFTLEDYCRVERLALDDFHQVEKLLERGQREGYLKARTADEIGRILVSGYGATIGRHHLAGICSLQAERYAHLRAGEIVGLYTITRFKGEGVGVKLVDRIKAEGLRLGLAYLFACTTQERVGHFFERQGFVRVSQADVPAEKWVSYDDARRKRIAVYRRDL